MTLLELYNKAKSINDSLTSADVPLKCNDNDFSVDFEIKSKDAIVSHIEVKQNLALTVEDLERLHAFLYAVKNNKQGCFTFTRLSNEQYEEVLRRFNKQREK